MLYATSNYAEECPVPFLLKFHSISGSDRKRLLGCLIGRHNLFLRPQISRAYARALRKIARFPARARRKWIFRSRRARRVLKIDHVWPPSRTRASWPPPRARGPPPVPQGRPRRTVRSGPSGKRRRGRYFCAHLMGPAAGMWEEEGSKVFKKSDEKRDSRSKYHFASNGTALVPRPTPSLVPVAGEVSLARVIAWF